MYFPRICLPTLSEPRKPSKQVTVQVITQTIFILLSHGELELSSMEVHSCHEWKSIARRVDENPAKTSSFFLEFH